MITILIHFDNFSFSLFLDPMYDVFHDIDMMSGLQLTMIPLKIRRIRAHEIPAEFTIGDDSSTVKDAQGRPQNDDIG